MIIKQYDSIQLNSGEIGAVVEILGNGVAFMVDIVKKDGWESVTVKKEEIQRVISQQESDTMVTQIQKDMIY